MTAVSSVTFHNMNGHIILTLPGGEVEALHGSVWDAAKIAADARLAVADVSDQLIRWKA